MKKQEKMKQKIIAQENARLIAEKIVLEDIWTQEQQIRFEEALLQYTSLSLDKWDRWTKISLLVKDKTKNQCIMRYRYLKEYVYKKNEIEAIAIV